MKSNFLSTWLPMCVGLVAVIGVTVAQGYITGRWTGKNVSEELRKDAAHAPHIYAFSIFI